MRKNRIAYFTDMIQKQLEFMNRCGETLDGYIANYGDWPDVPPIDSEGKSKTFTVPDKDVHLFDNYKPVPGMKNTFYQKCFGNGGSLIYEADYAALKNFERRLQEEIEWQKHYETKPRKS